MDDPYSYVKWRKLSARALNLDGHIFTLYHLGRRFCWFFDAEPVSDEEFSGMREAKDWAIGKGWFVYTVGGRQSKQSEG